MIADVGNKQQKKDRVLSNKELSDVWNVAIEKGGFQQPVLPKPIKSTHYIRSNDSRSSLVYMG